MKNRSIKKAMIVAGVLVGCIDIVWLGLTQSLSVSAYFVGLPILLLVILTSLSLWEQSE